MSPISEDINPKWNQFCRSCHAPVIFAKHERTGKTMIFDKEPTEDGQWHIKDGKAYYIDKKNYVDGLVDAPLYKTHFASCPHAQQHRRK